ncbi:MAG: hypothetical protein MUC41_12140 [Syntrophobacteraceae bacterium]|jgi:hypothetical protein|nr:hypothetical protein [Syntrophobacteraceae bacterium]
MARVLRVVSDNEKGVERRVLLPEEKHRHFRNIMGVLLQDAQKTWGELWGELQGEVVDGVLVLPDAQQGFKPACGWPEFLEKMWLLKHYIDHARRFSDERV